MEKWIDIKGFEGLYMVSDLGNIKSYKREENFLTPRVLTKGYLGVILYKDRKPTAFKVHRLVAINFIPNPENKAQVNHKDGNKHNNKISNLEWATNSENMRHSISMGLVNQRGENHAQAKLNAIDVFNIIKSKNSKSDLARQYNVTPATICSIFKGRSWSSITKIKVNGC